MILVLLALALAPSIGIILYVYHLDKYEKEPLSLLIKCFLLGIVSIVITLILEEIGGKTGLEDSVYIYDILMYAFLVVALSEEFSKYVFLRFYAYKKRDFNEPYDGIIYSVMISMGFATVENIFYVLDGGWGVGLMRAFTAVPMHACFAVVMGYFAGKAKFDESGREFLYLSLGFVGAVFLHGLYDFLLMQKDYFFLYILVIVLIFFSIRYSRKAMFQMQYLSPFKDVKDETEIEIH